jgi:hypothetical protein
VLCVDMSARCTPSNMRSKIGDHYIVVIGVMQVAVSPSCASQCCPMSSSNHAHNDLERIPLIKQAARFRERCSLKSAHQAATNQRAAHAHTALTDL